jgi:hypothetical protein
LKVRSLVLCALSLAAVPSAFSATLLHDYQLKNSLSDQLGGPDLTSNGGTLSASGYAFDKNQGPSLSSGITGTQTSVYSIMMYFSLTDLSGYRKLIDFANLGSDAGFYNLSTDLDFYNYGASGTPDFVSNELATVVLTRDGSGTLTGYFGGVQKFSFDDSVNNWGVFTGTNNIINFFQDDGVTNHNEASAGAVKRIEIYDGALTSTEVAAIDPTHSTPEPATWFLFAAGSLGVGLFGRKRLKR